MKLEGDSFSWPFISPERVTYVPEKHLGLFWIIYGTLHMHIWLPYVRAFSTILARSARRRGHGKFAKYPLFTSQRFINIKSSDDTIDQSRGGVSVVCSEHTIRKFWALHFTFVYAMFQLELNTKSYGFSYFGG